MIPIKISVFVQCEGTVQFSSILYIYQNKCLSTALRNTCLLLQIGNEFCSYMNTNSFLTLHTNNIRVYSRETHMFSTCVVILWAFSCESYTDTFLMVQKHETGFLVLRFLYITSKCGQMNVCIFI